MKNSILLVAILLFPQPALAMHLSEGILPAGWVILWFAAAIPFVARGVVQINRKKN